MQEAEDERARQELLVQKKKKKKTDARKVVAESLWFSTLTGNRVKKKRPVTAKARGHVYLAALERVHEHEHGLNFRGGGLDRKYENLSGKSMCKDILKQYGLEDGFYESTREMKRNESARTLPDTFLKAEIKITKRCVHRTLPASNSNSVDLRLTSARTVLLGKGIDMSLKQLNIYLKFFSDVLEAINSPMLNHKLALLKRSEFEAFLWLYLKHSTKYDRELQNQLVGEWLEGSIIGYDSDRRYLRVVEISYDEDTKKHVENKSMKRLVHIEQLSSEEEEEEEEEALDDTGELRDEHDERYLYKRGTQLKCHTKVKVQVEGKIFEFWERLDAVLGEDLLLLGNVEAQRMDKDEDVMTFPGFCAMQARFCGGDDEEMQIRMNFMRLAVFEEEFDWVDTLLLRLLALYDTTQCGLGGSCDIAPSITAFNCAG